MSFDAVSEHTADIPLHVPNHIVRSSPLGRGLTTNLHPHEVVSMIHRDFPEVFFAPNLMPPAGAWVFRRASDLRKIWMDTEHFSSREIAPYSRLAGGTWQQVPAEQDPPKHALFRTLITPIFAPKAVALLNDKVRAYARNDIGSFRDRGHCEFMGEFAFRFPIKIFLELIDRKSVV